MTDFGLNNRQIAVASWVLLLLMAALFNAGVRTSLRRLLRTSFNVHVLSWFLGTALYTYVLVFVLSELGLWTNSLLADTLIWFWLVAILSSLKLLQATSLRELIRGFMERNLKVTILIEFIIGSYPFALITEIILFPIIALITLPESIVKEKQAYTALLKALRILQGLITVFVILSAIRGIFESPGTIFNLDAIRRFILPIALSALLIPFVYLWLLVLNYGLIFHYYRWQKTWSGDLLKYARKTTVLNCRLSLWRQHQLRNQGFALSAVQSREQFDAYIRGTMTRST
ncbi:MAG: hypothetical protein JRN15_08040 [Nitrososphaerota archaeon]|nr:hypothetical protein [Nitrososphaerota archaeon]